MNETIELKNHTMEKRTFKEGAKEVITDLSVIKNKKAMFVKLFLFALFITIILNPIFTITGLGFINSVITTIVFPAIAIAIFQKSKDDNNGSLSLSKSIFEKILRLRIYALLFFMAIALALSVFIPLQVIISEIGLTGAELQKILPAFIEANANPEQFQIFSQDPLAQKMMNGVTNLNMTVFWLCWSFGGLGIILVSVNGFLALMQMLTLSYISVWDSLKMAIAFNFKNSGYFIGKTLGILVCVTPVFLFGGIIGQFFQSLTLLYTIYVFYKMIDDTIEEKEID